MADFPLISDVGRVGRPCRPQLFAIFSQSAHKLANNHEISQENNCPSSNKKIINRRHIFWTAINLPMK
jgi:hypothetical protein